MNASSPAPAPPPDRPATHTPTPAELAHRAKDEARDTGYEHAALFLLLIDASDAAAVLRSLNACEVEEICRVIVSLDAVNPRDARRVVQEFGVPASAIRTTAQGGPEAARHLLAAAFDAERAERLLDRVAAPEPSSP